MDLYITTFFVSLPLQMVDPYHNMLTWNRTEQGEWWYWKNKPANIGQMEE